MFHLFRKNHLFVPYCYSSSSSQIRAFLSRFPVLGFSSSSSPQQLMENKVRVSVWWDLDTCAVPSGVSYSKVAPSITRALRTNGINGPIDFHAYGDVSQFSEFERIALSSTGIRLRHITDEMRKHRKRKKARDYLFYDLRDWFSKNPPPVHLFIICGDVAINGIYVLHRLRMKNYNILVACPGMTYEVLHGATTIMWNWSSILRGEDLIGKHFNYPPFDSWYGDSKVTLEPFSAAEEPTSLQIAEILKPSSDIKSCEVSKSVYRLVKKISSSYPNGIPIGDLRAELTKCDLPLGKPFYGHKKFSDFLVSIPHARLQYLGEGKFCVHFIPSTTSLIKNNKRDSNVSNMDDDSKSFQSIPSQVAYGKSSFPLFKESNVHQLPNELQKTSLGCEEVVDVATAPLPHVQFPPNNSDISKNSEYDIVSSEVRFPVLGFSSSPLPPPQPPKVSVWWDVDNCGVPFGVSFWKVGPSIMAAVRANGIKGTIDIRAYYQSSKISNLDEQALLATGIELRTTSDGKNHLYKHLLMDLNSWVSKNPPPLHIFLISDDRYDKDFSGILHRLRMNNYNILIACPGRGSDILRSATTIMWQWSSMLKREDLIGKHFNYPPDGPFGSWYGNSKVPLENPFSTTEEPTSSQTRAFLSRFPVLGFSSSSSPQQLMENKVRVSVWWDLDTCAVPSGVSYSKVAPSIMGALRTNGIKCPIDIEAYGDVSQLSDINQEILFLTGIDLHHVPGGKKHAHRYFMDWVSKNPPPAHLFIISGDRDDDFVGAVSWLSNTSYNILLACPPKTDYVLCHNATIMWPWSSILKGDFSGKHFNNYPPYWYVDSKVPLENPFSASEDPTSSQNAEIHKPSLDIKLGGEVPESVSWQVRKILRLYPNGISIGDLRAELAKCDLPLGERFCGHEKFSNFLVSIPRVQLLDKGEGDFCVYLIPSKTPDNDSVGFEDVSPEFLEKKTTSHNPSTLQIVNLEK